MLINEVQGATIDGEQTDFIELINTSAEAVDISGYRLQDDKGSEEEYVIADGTVLEAGAIMVFYKDETFTFGLGGGGDVVTVQWTTAPHMPVFPTAPTTGAYAPSLLPARATLPGTADYTALRLNELNGNDKFIELYNTSDADIDIAGVYFTKDDEDTFKAAAGTVVPAHGFLTVWSEKSDKAESTENPDFPIFEFGLSADKSVKIELFAPDGTSIDLFKDDGMYDSKDKGSFARDVDGTGDWYIMTATEGSSNASAEKVEGSKIEW